MSTLWLLTCALFAALAFGLWQTLARARLRQQLARRASRVEDQSRKTRLRLARQEEELKELRIAKEMLERALDVSESSARAKHEFLANMSHEIRTPLNGVLGMSEVLLAGNLDPQEQRDIVRAMQTSGQALLHIIDDILALSKLEAGRVELEKRTIDLHSLVEDILESFARDAYTKNIALSASVTHAPHRVRIDSLRLRQILANLIGNALKFTQEGEVMVRARRLGAKRLAFEVRDTGIGIPKDKQNELFDAFTQADLSTSRNFGGTGLGLAISQRLVKLMDGSIRVESEPGGGSAFHFTVQVESEEEELTPPSRIMGCQVILIDPSPWQRRNLASLLESQGMIVEAFESGAEAFGSSGDYLLVSRHAEDPGRVVRELGAGAACFLMASIADPVGRQSASDLGFDGILSLPVHKSRLLATLEPSPSGRSAEPEFEEPNELLALHLPLRILVAEDNAVSQLVAEELLRVLGYRPDMAETGQEVLRRLETADYDVIFMDLVMPDMDGLETTRRIRSTLPPARQPKIVALTASVMSEQRDSCREAGMDEFLPKPMQLEATRQVLEQIAPRRQRAEGSAA